MVIFDKAEFARSGGKSRHSIRGCALPDPRPADGRQAPPDDRLKRLARYILEERERRQWHFPRAVFDEIPWETMLHLYASEPAPVSKAELVKAMLVAPELVDRWADYLEREGLLVKLQVLGGAVSLKLTREGLSSLEFYLLDRLVRADASEPVERSEGRPRLPNWAAGLLMLGAAILSAAMTWSLAAM
jgi:hypothetical protein